jgi:hypothetical protein
MGEKTERTQIKREQEIAHARDREGVKTERDRWGDEEWRK